MNRSVNPERAMAAALGSRTFGPAGVNGSARQALEQLAALDVGKRERRFLTELALHFGDYVPTKQLVDYVWQNDADGGPAGADSALSAMVKTCTPKLAPLGLDIETSYGVGKRLTWATAPEAPKPAPRHTPPPATLRPGDIDLGELDTGGPLGLDLAKLLEGRLLIQGVSGAGKSWTLRRLLEQTAALVPQIVVDPEGEFRSLAEEYGHLRIDAAQLDIAALATAARRAREHRLSLWLDMSQLDPEDLMKAAGSFFDALVNVPREHWHSCVVAIDEAHLVAPFGGYSENTGIRKAAIAAVSDVMNRGRKRGLCGVLATQRLARLAKSVASPVQNFLIGLNTLDLDIRRAAETIGWDARKGFDRLPMLEPGDFVAVGPCFSRSPSMLRVGPIRTAQGGATPTLVKPEPIDRVKAAELLDLDALVEASAADQAVRDRHTDALGRGNVRAFIRDGAFPDAGRLWAALRRLAPDGADVADLAQHLERSPEQVSAALALLDRYDALEFSEDEASAVRIAKDMT